MAEFPLQQVVDANLRLEQYRFRVQFTPHLVFEGAMNLPQRRQYMRIGHTPDALSEAEVFWDGQTGYGRRTPSGDWFKLRGKPFPDFLQGALQVVQDEVVRVVREDGDFWQVDIQPEHVPPRDNPERFYHEVFGEPVDAKSYQYVERIIEASGNIQMEISIRIARSNHLIRGIAVRTQLQGTAYDFTVDFDQIRTDVGVLPDDVEQRTIPDIQISPVMLLFDLLKVRGGWFDSKTHCPWAQRSLDLIKDMDARHAVPERQYREINDPTWSREVFTEQLAKNPPLNSDSGLDYRKHHPVVLGAFYEDWTEPWASQKDRFYHAWFASDSNYISDQNYYFDQNGYMRDYHHYGGESLGVEKYWYFVFRGYPDPTVIDQQGKERYYSARDWGYGGKRIDERLNRLTFTRAIHQYNTYTFEGKRRAYLMLGHVIHLLQDVGQPDHANLVPHPASGMNEKEAYLERFQWEGLTYCEFVATEAALAACGACAWIVGVGCLVCAAGTFAAAELICRESISESEMGYERLVAEKWSLSSPGVDHQIHATGILNQPDYDSYFREVSQFSSHTAAQLGLQSPLGCGTLKLVPPIPGADPDIEANDPAQARPYLELTDKIVSHIVGASAGLIQRFYEIVNHPPFVERVVVIKAVPGLVPTGFGCFNRTLNQEECSEFRVCYDAKWEQSNARQRDLLVSDDKLPLCPSHQAYMFVQFGPNIEPLKSKVVVEKTLEVKLVGPAPDGSRVSIPVKLMPAHDGDIGQFYWGTFKPVNRWGRNYKLTIEIQAFDTSAHFTMRARPGHEIDSNPATVALVNADELPLYNMIGYEPGADRNHTIEIGVPIVADELEPNNSFDQATSIQLAEPGELMVLFGETEVSFNGLSLHDGGDSDFFKCQYRSNTMDQNTHGSVTKITNQVYLMISPAVFYAKAVEEYGGCIMLEVYDSRQALRQTAMGNISIGTPTDFFPDDTVFVVVKNADWNGQGPLRYGFTAGYHHWSTRIDGFLYPKWRLFWEEVLEEVVSLPRPEEEVVIFDEYSKQGVTNVGRLIVGLEHVLLSINSEGNFNTSKDRAISEAELKYRLGQVAHKFGRHEDVIRLYTQSSGIFRERKVQTNERKVLQDLLAIYLSLGRSAEAKQISERLEEIG